MIKALSALYIRWVIPKVQIKKLTGKKIASVVFNLKRGHVTIKHISCAKNFSQRHNPIILTSSRKEMVINILDGNKESETNSR